MNILIGYTGFVGSNLHSKYAFDGIFNSKNIEKAFGSCPDLCIYAGVRAEKFLANREPENDFAIIENAIENIKKINPKKLVLISTIDVFKNPNNAFENTAIETDGLHPYGFNRYQLEKWVMENIEDYHILRLPGLFGKNIKKNFIYDLINIIPAMFNEAKFLELSSKASLINEYYIKQDNGFYKFSSANNEDKEKLRHVFNELGFSAVNFTDSRGLFQFYNLDYLWEHIKIVIENNIRIMHLASEPLLVSEIYKAVKGTDFVNEVAKEAPQYNFKTVYVKEFNGSDGYIFNKKKVLDDIINFTEDFKDEAVDI